MERGLVAEARARYADAAEHERLAFEALAPGDAETRGLVGLSAVSLYVRAGRDGQAERLAHRLLDEPALPPFVYAELRAILAGVLHRLRLGLKHLLQFDPPW